MCYKTVASVPHLNIGNVKSQALILSVINNRSVIGIEKHIEKLTNYKKKINKIPRSTEKVFKSHFYAFSILHWILLCFNNLSTPQKKVSLVSLGPNNIFIHYNKNYQQHVETQTEH